MKFQLIALTSAALGETLQVRMDELMGSSELGSFDTEVTAHLYDTVRNGPKPTPRLCSAEDVEDLSPFSRRPKTAECHEPTEYLLWS